MLSKPQSSEGLVGAGGIQFHHGSHGDRHTHTPHTRLFQFPSPQTSPRCCRVVSGHDSWLLRVSDPGHQDRSPMSWWPSLGIFLQFLLVTEASPHSLWLGTHRGVSPGGGRRVCLEGCLSHNPTWRNFTLQNGVCSNLVFLILKEVKIRWPVGYKKEKHTHTQTWKKFF